MIGESFSKLFASFGILFSGILIVFLQSGTFKALGVLFEDVVQEYHTSNIFAGWVFSFQAAGAFTIAGVAGVALEGFQSRIVGVSGGILFGLGLVLNGVTSQNAYLLFIFIGITAVGGGLLYISSVMSLLDHYDEDTFPMAYSVREVFNYFGIIVIPLLLDILLRQYGLNGAFLILGGLGWNSVISGVLMKPPKYLNPKIHKSNCAADYVVLEDRESHANSSTPENVFKDRPSTDLNPGKSKSHQKPALSKSIKLYQFPTVLPNFVSTFIKLVSRHRQFAIFVIIHLVNHYMFAVWAIFLVPFGKAKGFPTGYPVLLSTAGGVGGFIGKIAVIPICYYERLNILTSSIIPSIICGCSLVGYLVGESFIAMLIASLLCGFGLAFADTALNSSAPSYLCTTHKRRGITLTYLTSGVMVQIGGIVAGALIDITGSYTAVFEFLLVSDIIVLPLSGVLLYIDPIDPHICSNSHLEP